MKKMKWMRKFRRREHEQELAAVDGAWICRRCEKARRVTAGLKHSGWGFFDWHSYGDPPTASARLYPLCEECNAGLRAWLWGLRP